jgi:hypothetical protein
MEQILAQLNTLLGNAPEAAQLYNQIKYADDYKEAEIKRLEAQREQDKIFMYASLALIIILISLIIFKFTK